VRFVELRSFASKFCPTVEETVKIFSSRLVILNFARKGSFLFESQDSL
jgi:hypothetical protein